MAKSLRVGIASLGTVGASVVALLRDNAAALAARAGRPNELVRAASRTPKPDLGLSGDPEHLPIQATPGAESRLRLQAFGCAFRLPGLTWGCHPLPSAPLGSKESARHAQGVDNPVGFVRRSEPPAWYEERPRICSSRVLLRSRGAISRRCPVLVTLRVRGDVPPLRRACFVRASRASLREGRAVPGSA